MERAIDDSQIPVIEFNLVLSQELNKLISKTHALMVLLLLRYVSTYLIDMRLTHGKRSISSLP